MTSRVSEPHCPSYGDLREGSSNLFGDSVCVFRVNVWMSLSAFQPPGTEVGGRARKRWRSEQWRAPDRQREVASSPNSQHERCGLGVPAGLSVARCAAMSDLSPLPGCSNLTALNLFSCPAVSDVRPLKGR